MNSEEGMSMSKMAVAILLVVLVIGAVVGLVYAAYSWFTSGVDKLSQNVVSIDKSAYSQYDDQVVTGTDVLSALKQYREADIAIFICNTDNGGYVSSDTSLATAYNYCALITDTQEADTKGYQAASQLSCDADSGKWSFPSFIYTDDEGISIKKNTNFSPTTTPGKKSQYVKQSARWYANIVYDQSTDEIAGILFRQMK